MDLEKLTIKQAREILEVFGVSKKKNLQSCMVGKYVIVRSYNEGVNAGVVVEADDTGVILKDARRLWRHVPAEKSVCWYEGVSKYGLSEDSKISCAATIKVISENYSMTTCTDQARKSIESKKSHEQKD